MTRSEREVKEKCGGETGTASLLLTLLTPLPVQSLLRGDLELRGAKEPALGKGFLAHLWSQSRPELEKNHKMITSLFPPPAPPMAG